jgi:hypothetical protein
VDDLRFSLVIPYKQRLDNLRAVLTSLTEQSMDASSFEVVVGAMEYDPAYVRLCAEFSGRLSIVSVLSADEWNTSQARNLGIRQARGRIVVVLDADVVTAPRMLDNLYERHFQHGQNVCVLGQVMGYEEVMGAQVDTVTSRPYADYRQVLTELATADRSVLDPRWSDAYAPAFARFPWAFARTGLMALPAETIRRHGLLLDEGFLGWGAEDQEWALRISRTGTPLVLGQDVWGLHLPHRRDFAAQDDSAKDTNRYYLAKWPRLELELALAFGGWIEADRIFPEAEREVARVSAGGRLGVLKGRVAGQDTLAVGAVLDERGSLADPDAEALFDTPSAVEVLPLAGFALPYGDQELKVCHVLPAAHRLDTPYREAVLREAGRVCVRLAEPVGAGAR